VLREIGLELPETTEVRVWDTTADTGSMVLPAQAPATKGWPAETLAEIVTQEDSMNGASRLDNVLAPRRCDSPKPWIACTIWGKQGSGRVIYPWPPTRDAATPLKRAALQIERILTTARLQRATEARRQAGQTDLREHRWRTAPAHRLRPRSRRRAELAMPGYPPPRIGVV
jgi:hypothetical protein